MQQGGESILDTIYEEDNNVELDDDDDDVEMLDIEEGEFVQDQNGHAQAAENTGGSANASNMESQSKLAKRTRNKKNKKKKNKRNNGPAAPVTNINRFVIETCRRLKEKKSYMIYTAIGCLGVSALSDLIKEVDAVQACGGQMTADGRRYRNGGGILWSIMKSREPKAYVEIMKKAKEFEKQFRQQNVRPTTEQTTGLAQEPAIASTDQASMVSDGPEIPDMQNQAESAKSSDEKRVSVHNRIRVPVTYDDLLLEETQDASTLTV